MRYSLLLLFVICQYCSQDETTIKIKGSDTEVNLAALFAESFHKVNPNIFVSVSGGGSGLGIASLLNGTADIANASRTINAEELSLFQKKKTVIDSFSIAEDAVAFVVSKNLLLDSISPTVLARVFNGKVSNWKEITGQNIPINIYGRQSNSGTHDFVKEKLNIQFSPNAKEMNGNAQILEAIKADASGIGYVGAGYVGTGSSLQVTVHRLQFSGDSSQDSVDRLMEVKKGGDTLPIHDPNNKGIKVLTIFVSKGKKAVSPLDAAQIAAGNYFFQRPLLQYYKKTSLDKVKPFLDFESSEVGKRLVKDEGYYPIKTKL